MDKNQQAKREVIATFFDNAEARIAFLSELAQTGHKSEAMTLCLTYLDSFAQWLRWPATSSSRNFVEAVIQFGDEPLMGLARFGLSVLTTLQKHIRVPTHSDLAHRYSSSDSQGPSVLHPWRATRGWVSTNHVWVEPSPVHLRGGSWTSVRTHTSIQLSKAALGLFLSSPRIAPSFERAGRRLFQTGQPEGLASGNL
jgi:hypothetical protein